MPKVLSIRLLDEDLERIQTIKEKLQDQAQWTYNGNYTDTDIIKASLKCYEDYLNGNIKRKED